MEKVDIFSNLMEMAFKNSGAKYIDKYCEQHKKQWIQFKDGRANCPSCFCRSGGQSFKEQVNNDIKKEQDSNIHKHLERYSVHSNQKLLTCTLEGYAVNCEETKKVKNIALQCARWYNFGNNFNMVLNGKAGTGKSHLAYAIAKAASEKRRCLFISVPKMVDLILDSFENKDSKFTKGYFLKIMEEADLLVIDDLGAEVGRVDTEKVASDFITKLLFSVYESRQGKSTITTSNLLGDKMIQVYDSRLVSRLKADTTAETRFTFHTAKDMR